MSRGTIGFVVVLAALPVSARAGGLLVGESGSQGQQRGGAFVAKADDPTAIYFNPAGLMKAKRYQLYLGGSVVDYSGTYQRAGVYPTQPGEDPAWEGQPFPKVENGSAPQPIPFLAATQRFGHVAIGEGVYAPQSFPGRELPWETTVNGVAAPGPQRYDVVEQTAVIALPSVAAAYSVFDWLDVGARVSWGVSTIKARVAVWGMQNGDEEPLKDADFRVDAADYFVLHYGFGLLARPNRSIEIGAAFNSPLHARTSGDGTVPPLGNPLGGDPIDVLPVPDEFAKCHGGGTQAQLAACVNLDVPMNATLGGRYIVRDEAGEEKADVELDVRWENWKNASDIRVIVDGYENLMGRYLEETVIKHGYRDVVSVRLGGSYRLSLAGNPLELRAGVSYDTAAAPESWTRVDLDGSDRFIGAAGIAYDFGKVRVDLGGAWAYSPDRTVTDSSTDADRTQPDPIQPLKQENEQDFHPINAGTYTNGYAIVNLGVTASW